MRACACMRVCMSLCSKTAAGEEMFFFTGDEKTVVLCGGMLRCDIMWVCVGDEAASDALL